MKDKFIEMHFKMLQSKGLDEISIDYTIPLSPQLKDLLKLHKFLMDIYPAVARVVNKIFNLHDRKEIFQEVLADILDKTDKYDPERADANINGFVYSIASNAVKQYFNRNYKRNASEIYMSDIIPADNDSSDGYTDYQNTIPDTRNISTEDIKIIDENIQFIQDAVNNIRRMAESRPDGKSYWNILIDEFYINKKTFKEISELIDVSENSLKTQKTNLQKVLLNELDDIGKIISNTSTENSVTDRLQNCLELVFTRFN